MFRTVGDAVQRWMVMGMREKLIELLETTVSKEEVAVYGEVYVSTSMVAEHLIANDVVPVVRCKDCKYWRDSWVAPDGKHEHGECYIEDADDVIVGRWDDDFCSYGERKDKE